MKVGVNDDEPDLSHSDKKVSAAERVFSEIAAIHSDSVEVQFCRHVNDVSHSCFDQCVCGPPSSGVPVFIP